MRNNRDETPLDIAKRLEHENVVLFETLVGRYQSQQVAQRIERGTVSTPLRHRARRQL